MSNQLNMRIRGVALQTLLEEFNIDPYPSKERISEIAYRVKLGHRKVTVWFQNRRQRLRIVKYTTSRKRSMPKNTAYSEFQVFERKPRPSPPPLVHYLLPPPLEETNTSAHFYDSTSHNHIASARGPIHRKEPPFRKHPYLCIESLLNPQDKEYPYRICSNLEIKTS